MATVDSVSGSKPDSQDLEDILIEQLPEDDDKARQYKEAWYRFSAKLKEIFNFYDTGDLVGVQGPRGPQGVPGVPGTDGKDGQDASTSAETIEKVMGCKATTQVGDFVYQDTSRVNEVTEATDNNTPEPIIGVVAKKSSDVSCSVILTGLFDTDLGIGIIYLGEDGAGSLTKPDVGLGQILGYSFGDGQGHCNPNLQRSKDV